VRSELSGDERTVPPAYLPILQEIAQPPVPELERPFVTIAFAQTLDGRIATRNGDSQWISGQESLAFCHCLRAAHDAILVGIGTVLRDDPRLTTRLVPGPSPTRVIIDSELRMPLEAAMLREGPAEETIIIGTERAVRQQGNRLRACGVQVLIARTDANGRVDFEDALRSLALAGLRSVLIEGGARIITTALRARLVDRIAVSIAPKLIGTGIEAVGDLDIGRLTDAVGINHSRVLRLGEDLLIVGDLDPFSDNPVDADGRSGGGG
jgi:riboflavin-specific deaminase-like protein